MTVLRAGRAVVRTAADRVRMPLEGCRAKLAALMVAAVWAWAPSAQAQTWPKSRCVKKGIESVCTPGVKWENFMVEGGGVNTGWIEGVGLTGQRISYVEKAKAGVLDAHSGQATCGGIGWKPPEPTVTITPYYNPKTGATNGTVTRREEHGQVYEYLGSTVTPMDCSKTQVNVWYQALSVHHYQVRCPDMSWNYDGPTDPRQSPGTCYQHCPNGQAWVPEANACKPFVDRIVVPRARPGQCFGNPIHPFTGSKSESIALLSTPLGMDTLSVHYDSRSKLPFQVGEPYAVPSAPWSMGELWSTSMHKALYLRSANGNPAVTQAARGLGIWQSFNRNPSTGLHEPVSPATQDRIFGFGPGWMYRDAAGLALEVYPTTYYGTIPVTTRAYARGGRLNYSYSTSVTTQAPLVGLLMSVQDQFGRKVSFEYEAVGSAGARITKIIDVDGQSVAVAYDTAGNLTQLTWPDGATKRYLYEDAALPWALTGKIVESGKRVGTYTYDPSGVAIGTQGAGGVAGYSATYGEPPRRVMTESYDAANNVIWRHHSWAEPKDVNLTRPDGSSSTFAVTVVNGQPLLASQSQPAGSGCAASTSSRTYDANGNMASEDDFNGTRSCMVYDLSRNLATTTVEGLANTVACGTVTGAGATLPAGSRKTSTQWHPDWSLPTKQAEPGRLTTWVYNGQPDPFASNAVASCAPNTVPLPDNKPIAVLCKKVEQATTDVDGSKGFSATLQSGVVNRVWTYTYNQHGQVLTAKSPRTDVNETTTYAYYTDTTAEHTLGDLKSVTNAKNQVTQFPLYNKHGQVLRSIDANNVATDYTYDARQRLKSITAGGLTTTMDYLPTGQLQRATQPGGRYLEYEYDDAQRQVAVRDHRNNRIEYTLDNAGNQTAEKVNDPSGALRRQMTRVMDALGRVQQATGRN